MTGWLGRATSALVTKDAGRTPRAPRSRRTAYRLRVARRILAAALVAVAVWTTTERLRPIPPTPARVVVTAAHDLPAGTTLTSADLTLAPLGSGSADIAGLNRVEAAVGRVLASPMSAGEVLSRTRFRGSELLVGMPSGQLAVAVPVANAPIVSALVEGDHVTLVGTSGDSATVDAVVLSLPRAASSGVGGGLGGGALGGSSTVEQGGATPLIVAVPADKVAVVAQEVGRAGASAGFVVALHGRS